MPLPNISNAESPPLIERIGQRLQDLNRDYERIYHKTVIQKTEENNKSLEYIHKKIAAFEVYNELVQNQRQAIISITFLLFSYSITIVNTYLGMACTLAGICFIGYFAKRSITKGKILKNYYNLPWAKTIKKRKHKQQVQVTL